MAWIRNLNSIEVIWVDGRKLCRDLYCCSKCQKILLSLALENVENFETSKTFENLDRKRRLQSCYGHWYQSPFCFPIEIVTFPSFLILCRHSMTDPPIRMQNFEVRILIRRLMLTDEYISRELCIQYTCICKPD